MKQAAIDAAIADALSKHPECSYAQWESGMSMLPFRLTIVVNLWRNEECYLAGDPPRHVCDGYNPEYEPELTTALEASP